MDEDHKISFDKIVEGAKSYLNNFNEISKIPCRYYRLEEITMSKLRGEKYFWKSLLAKKKRTDKMDFRE